MRPSPKESRPDSPPPRHPGKSSPGPGRIDSESILSSLRRSPGSEILGFTCPVEEIDPLALVESMPEEKELFYWEKPDEEFAIAAGGALRCLRATGKERFSDIARKSAELAGRIVALSALEHTLAQPLLLGGYSFGDHNIHENWKRFGAARFTLPEWSLVRSGSLHLLTVNVPAGSRPAETTLRLLEEQLELFERRCREARRTTPPGRNGQRDRKNATRLFDNAHSRKEWDRRVERSRRMISDGLFDKIVLSRSLDLEAEKEIDLPGVLYRFRHRFPGCYNFMVRPGGTTVFAGASPERLVSLNRRQLLTDGLAGSTARGESALEDLALGRRLMDSFKERSEHRYVIEEIRNNLRPFTSRIDYPQTPGIKKLNNVQHLYTPIRAEVRKPMSIHELLGKLHPTPAVGGFPKEKAVPHIHHLESLDRGWYSGPLGWVTLSGNGEFAVAIRSALIDGKCARLYAGSGIVRDSDPLREWEETAIKFRPVLEALEQSATGTAGSRRNDE